MDVAPPTSSQEAHPGSNKESFVGSVGDAALENTSLLMTANVDAVAYAPQQLPLHYQNHHHGDREEDHGDHDHDDDEDDDVPHTTCVINKDVASIISNSVQPMDIICGRGSRVAHPGNQRFRKVVLERKVEYQKAQRRDEKTRITHEIVETLRSDPEPSRFLLKDTKTNEWYDVGIEYAREKVSHALRSRPNEERRKRSDVNKQLPNKSNNKRSQQQRGAGPGNDNTAAGSACNSNGGSSAAGGDQSTNNVSSSAELEETVKSLIHDQQQLLQSMIQSESFPVYT